MVDTKTKPAAGPVDKATTETPVEEPKPSMMTKVNATKPWVDAQCANSCASLRRCSTHFGKFSQDYIEQAGVKKTKALTITCHRSRKLVLPGSSHTRFGNLYFGLLQRQELSSRIIVSTHVF
jgi:hypothetical protein